ncbi:MAG: hypothetical protein KDD63_03265 [Bacteroidetes bacterium]|nr:hypothetical protein [Bacteroidota bacterium]
MRSRNGNALIPIDASARDQAAFRAEKLFLAVVKKAQLARRKLLAYTFGIPHEKHKITDHFFILIWVRQFKQKDFERFRAIIKLIDELDDTSLLTFLDLYDKLPNDDHRFKLRLISSEGPNDNNIREFWKHLAWMEAGIRTQHQKTTARKRRNNQKNLEFQLLANSFPYSKELYLDYNKYLSLIEEYEFRHLDPHSKRIRTIGGAPDTLPQDIVKIKSSLVGKLGNYGSNLNHFQINVKNYKKELLIRFKERAVSIAIKLLDQYENILRSALYRFNAYSEVEQLQKKIRFILDMQEANRNASNKSLGLADEAGYWQRMARVYERKESAILELSKEYPILTFNGKKVIEKARKYTVDKLRSDLNYENYWALHDLEKARNALLDDPNWVFKADILFAMSMKLLKIKDGSIEQAILEEKARSVSGGNIWDSLKYTLIGIALSLIPGGGLIGFVALTADFALSAKLFRDEVLDRRKMRALFKVGFHSSAPDDTWFLIEFASFGLYGTHLLKVLRLAKKLSKADDVAALARFEDEVGKLKDLSIAEKKQAMEWGLASLNRKRVFRSLSKSVDTLESGVDQTAFYYFKEAAYYNAKMGVYSFDEFLNQFKSKKAFERISGNLSREDYSNLKRWIDSISDEDLVQIKQAHSEGLKKYERELQGALRESKKGGKSNSFGETGIQMEKRLINEHEAFGESVKGSRIMYKGGGRRSLNTFYREMKKARKSGARLPEKFQTEVLEMTTIEFIRSNTRLKRIYQALGKNKLVEEMDARIKNLQRHQSSYPIKSKEFEQLQKQIKEARKELDEVVNWEWGLVKIKRPDLVEVFPKTKEVVVTDITKIPVNKWHNFKTQFYAEVIKEIFGSGWTVRAVDASDKTINILQ